MIHIYYFWVCHTLLGFSSRKSKTDDGLTPHFVMYNFSTSREDGPGPTQKFQFLSVGTFTGATEEEAPPKVVVFAVCAQWMGGWQGSEHSLKKIF